MPAFATTFLGSEPLAAGTMLFRFARPDGFTFEAGQSVNVTLVDPPETDAKGNMRTFSLVSAPFEPELAIATRVRDTAFKRVLARLERGARVKLRGPGGRFVLPEDGSRPVVMAAGGIGITPFMSMLREAAHRREMRPFLLLYSNRRPEDAPFLAELEAIAQRMPTFRLVATMTGLDGTAASWSGERAPIDAAFFARHIEAAWRPVHFIAGPPGMVAALKRMLHEQGVAEPDLRTDEFFGY